MVGFVPLVERVLPQRSEMHVTDIETTFANVEADVPAVQERRTAQAPAPAPEIFPTSTTPALAGSP
ncbi:MAG: hypothetical protein ABIW17_07960, partial [Marmoricola sp.]